MSLMKKSDQQSKTHFGYETVETAEKAERVAKIFHSVAKKYDVDARLVEIYL